MDTEKGKSQYTNTSYEEAMNQDFMDYETDIHIRHGFIRKVFALLFLCLAVTAGIGSIFRYVEAAKTALLTAPSYTFFILLGLIIFITLILVCVPVVARTFPANLILILIYSLAYGVLLSFATVFYSADAIIFAALLTVVITLVLMIFAIQTRFDFTGWGPYLLVISICLLFVGIFALIFRTEFMQILYASIGTVVVSIYIIFDVQLIIGGRKHQLHPGDYIVAVFLLYTDIINLFLFVLQLVGNRS